MNVRIFLTFSSVILLGWMTASYVSDVPVEGHAGPQAQQLEGEDATLVSAH